MRRVREKGIKENDEVEKKREERAETEPTCPLHLCDSDQSENTIRDTQRERVCVRACV